MKMKALAIGLFAASSLVACQAEQETGMRDDNNNNGVQNTQFQRMADDMYEEGNNANRYDNDRGMVQNTNYDVAERAADKIAKDVEGVDRAYVLKTRDNAYVAAVLDNGETGDISDEKESEITKAVKNTDKDINNVYVSTNPDFVDLTNNYVNDVQNGDPIRGFFQEFGEMVDRIFPEAR